MSVTLKPFEHQNYVFLIKQFNLFLIFSHEKTVSVNLSTFLNNGVIVSVSVLNFFLFALAFNFKLFEIFTCDLFPKTNNGILKQI